MDQILLPVAVVAGLVAVGILAYGVISSRRAPSVVQERLGRYAETSVQASVPSSAPAESKPRQSPLGERLNEALRNFSFFGKVQDNLNSADIKLNVGEFFAFFEKILAPFQHVFTGPGNGITAFFSLSAERPAGLLAGLWGQQKCSGRPYRGAHEKPSDAHPTILVCHR